MAKTVLLTGASSGIGRATALYFQQKGWNVIATMRSPEKSTLGNIQCLPLDVTDPTSIANTVGKVLRLGPVDVLVNNAGYALMGAFETCSPEEIRRQFETNVFGLMEVTRSLLPHFRDRRSGTIVNIASVGGRVTFPIYSLYHSTKWAVEGFSESLQYELEPFNIRVKIIEPGPIKTDFYGRSATVAKRSDLTVYDAFVNKLMPKMNQYGEKGGTPEDVAAMIFQAATDGTKKLRYPVGGNAGLLLGLRKVLSDNAFSTIIRSELLKD
jgi:NAD(P)-dependent dehydrogenase (short-subunit alcohol dehydrogenase family)